tara:strand:- start:95 stop:346 length:252 start_codon:yes stop_codon:yes gene_type:complete
MTTLWFLMILVTTPYTPAVEYQGFAAYLTKEACEIKRIYIENYVGDIEKTRKRTSYVQSYCMEVQAFDTAIKKFKGIGNDIDA